MQTLNVLVNSDLFIYFIYTMYKESNSLSAILPYGPLEITNIYIYTTA